MIALNPVSLEIQFSGEKNYKPEGIEYNKSYAVVSTHSRKRVASFDDGKKKEVVEVFFWVINDHGRLTKIIHTNCFVKIVC